MTLSGFGTLPAVSWRGMQQQREASYRPGALPLRRMVNANVRLEAQQFWTPARTVEMTQSVGASRTGSPVSSFNNMHFAGLGAIGCRDVEPLLQELKNIINVSGSKLSASSLASAKAVYDDIDSYALYVPVLGSDCSKHVAELTATIASLRAELGIGAPPALRPNSATPADPDAINPTVKFALIGGAVVAGIIGLAVITGNVASITKVFR